MKWYIKVLGDWTNFKGRARRQEYWMFALFNFLFGLAARLIDYITGIAIFELEDGQKIGPVSLVYSLALIVPGLAVLVRRLHDIGKSGWFIFVPLGMMAGIAILMGIGMAVLGPGFVVLMSIIVFLSVIGIGIWIIVLLATPGELEPNKWGPNPAFPQHHDEDYKEL